MPADSEITRKRKQREGKKVIIRFFDAFNKRDTETMMKLLDDEHVDHTFFGSQPVSPEAVARAIAGMVETFPDWVESIDAIIPQDDGETFVVRQTGKGTQQQSYLNRDPKGKQIATVLTTTLRIVNGKIVEYRSQFPFRTPWEEEINTAHDLDEARAEQGGVTTAAAPEMQELLEEYAEGYIGDEELRERKIALEADTPRCQALLAENMRRCQNRAEEGSLYCSMHSEPGAAGSFGAKI